MASRLKLQSVLEDILGSKNVYFQPPESVKILYPAIVYFRNDISKLNADDGTYVMFKSYEITVIDNHQENPAIDKILMLPKSSLNRHYVAEGLYHDVLSLFY